MRANGLNYHPVRQENDKKHLTHRSFEKFLRFPASRKGLRHGFGVTAVSKSIALNMVQKWLGHSQLTTMAIYANAVGEEEQSIASRMWN
jgi:site-specific recombinase XerD